MTTQPTLLDLLDQPRRPTTRTRDRSLLDHLIRTGRATETGLTRRARLRTCPCTQVILAALDDDTCALEVHADPIPLTPLGEALAHIEGRWTYMLTRAGGGWTLDRRDASKITHRPAGTQPRCDVVREHRCRTPRPGDPLTAATSFAEALAPTYPPNSPAPF